MSFRQGFSLALIAGIIILVFSQVDVKKSEHLLPAVGNDGREGLGQAVLFLPPAKAATRSTLSGKQLYTRRCGACHSVDQNRVGPRHRGVFGRKAGSVSDFTYTKALKKLNLVWNEKNLDRWLTNPTAMAPGTAMGFRVKKPAERRAIVEYLKSVSK